MGNESNGSNRNPRYRVTNFDDITTDIPLTVKPLKPCEPCTLPIIAVRPDKSVVSEKTGQVLTFDQYAEALPTMPRHLVVTFSSDTWLWLLHERWQGHPLWRWTVMVQRKPRDRMRQHVSYYGFRRKDRRAFANPVLDASSFTRDLDTDLIALGQWVRDFCNIYGLRVRASAAGIAAQLLRHPMFYPDARRAVPKFINDTARRYLPGPYYESYADTAQTMTAAMYIDQEAAYHYAALTTPLPHANTIRASGHTRSRRVFARPGGELFARLMQKHGLIHCQISVPHVSPKRHRFVPRIVRIPGLHDAWLWTNELPYLESLGVHVWAIYSVWGSKDIDPHIRDYAQWARDMSRKHPHLKALLLMPYGALGRRPNTLEIHSPGGDESLLLAGRWIDGTRSHTVNVQTYTANALQLGLIQAHVRTLSLDMARQLSAAQREIVSIYADGIFIKLDDSKQVPMFAPWRLKEDSLEVHLRDSMRVPVRATVRRDYLYTQDKMEVSP